MKTQRCAHFGIETPILGLGLGAAGQQITRAMVLAMTTEADVTGYLPKRADITSLAKIRLAPFRPIKWRTA